MDSAGLSVAEYNRLPLFSRVSFGISQKNAQQSKYSDSYRIIQVFDDAQRRKGSQFGGKIRIVGLDHDSQQGLRARRTDEHAAAALHLGADRKSTRLNSSHSDRSRMPSSA